MDENEYVRAEEQDQNEAYGAGEADPARETVNEESSAGEGASENKEEEERTGWKKLLFGKRERNDTVMSGIYVLAAIYLYYTAYAMIKDVVTGEVEFSSRFYTIYIIFAIIFAVGATFVLYGCWRSYKEGVERQKEIERKAAEERGETWSEETAPRQTIMGMIRGDDPIIPKTIHDRASAYVNPADDEDEDEYEEEDLEEETAEPVNGTDTAPENAPAAEEEAASSAGEEEDKKPEEGGEL